MSLPLEILELKNLKILKLQANNFENKFKFLNNASENFEEIKQELQKLKIKSKTFEDEFLDENEFIFTPKKQKPIHSANLDHKETTPNNDLQVMKLKQKIKELERQLDRSNARN